MNLKRSKGGGKKHVKKNTNRNTFPQIHPTSGINLEDYAIDNFFRAHYANHSKKTCPEFMNLLKEMILPWELQEEDEEEEKEEEEEEVEPSSNINLILDDSELDDIDDEIMEKACVGSNYNLQSKGAPKINDFLSTLKMGSL
jgi:hypothetical protein